MKIEINNNQYYVYMIPANDKKLKTEDGEYHTGVTDMHKKEIYIAEGLNKDTRRYTIIHELTHALIDSYGFLQVEWNDEIVADFIGNYLMNILKSLDDLDELDDILNIIPYKEVSDDEFE